MNDSLALPDFSTEKEEARTSRPINVVPTKPPPAFKTTGVITPAKTEVIPDASPKPPYHHVTEPDVTKIVRQNITSAPPEEQSDSVSAGVIAGVVCGVIALIIIIVVIVFILRKKKFRKRKNVTKFENPEYANQKYRFSRDSALYVGPTVNMQRYANQNDTSSCESLSKKQPPPRPPMPRTAREQQKDHKGKRHAPAPPNPFTGEVEDEGGSPHKHSQSDLYEKDSHRSTDSLELQTFTARNESAEKGDAEAEPAAEDSQASYPLLRKKSPPSPAPATAKAPVAAHDDEFDDDTQSDASSAKDVGASHDKSGLLAKPKTGSNASLDDYDKSKNPFFAS